MGLHLVFSIVNGTRPAKPENAITIGLSDLLWELLQACWNEDRSRRPRMDYVEVQVGNAASWQQIPSRGSVPFPLRPDDSSQNPPSPSSTRTRNSSAYDLPRLSIPAIRIDVVGPEENSPYPMQEFYPPPSPISTNSSESHSNEALINRLDGVSFRAIWSSHGFDAGLSF